MTRISKRAANARRLSAVLAPLLLCAAELCLAHAKHVAGDRFVQAQNETRVLDGEPLKQGQAHKRSSRMLVAVDSSRYFAMVAGVTSHRWIKKSACVTLCCTRAPLPLQSRRRLGAPACTPSVGHSARTRRCVAPSQACRPGRLSSAQPTVRGAAAGPPPAAQRGPPSRRL